MGQDLAIRGVEDQLDGAVRPPVLYAVSGRPAAGPGPRTGSHKERCVEQQGAKLLLMRPIDIAVYRPSTGYWYALLSSTGWSNFDWAWWGATDDVPVPGDGVADVAVYRPSTGAWYVMNVPAIIGWGEATDVPILVRK